MQLKKANIWNHVNEFDYVCITTNSYIKSNGELCMGAGIALEANQRIKGLAKELGYKIRNTCGHLGIYNCINVGKWIAFQTKIHYKYNTPIDVLKYSIQKLYTACMENPNKTFALPFPAINHGGKSAEEVYPLIKHLPDNVTVFHLQDLDL